MENTNLLLRKDIQFESIEASCPSEKSKECNSCSKNLEERALFGFEYFQYSKKKGLLPVYTCFNKKVHCSKERLENYNKMMVYEEDIVNFNIMRKITNSMMYAEEFRDFINVICNRVGNPANELCKNCKTDLEGNVMMAFGYYEFFPKSGGADIMYQCSCGDFSRSREQLGAENKDIIYEE